MDVAFSTIAQKTFTALDFAALDAREIARLRPHLLCTGCSHKAYYRCAARSGQGPCFGARHSETCTLAVRTDDPWGEIGVEQVQRWEADQTRIVLNLSSPGGGSAVEGSESSDTRASGVSFSAPGSSRSQIQRNPEKLLRMLVQVEAFRTSRLVLSTGHGDFAIGDFFVEMNAASRERHADQFRGFWGMPRFSNVWNGVRIFNGAPRPSLGFEMSDELVRTLELRYGLSTIEELRSRYVLFIGRARITSGDSFMMDVPSLRHVAVLPAHFQDPGT